jgi:hypothetical protein
MTLSRLEKHGAPIGHPNLGLAWLGARSIYVHDDDSFPFLSQPTSMTTIAADSLFGLAMIAIMTSETFETSTYSPNGGVQFV